MKMAKKQAVEEVETCKRPRMGTGWTQISKSKTRPRGLCLKEAGQSVDFLLEGNGQRSTSESAETLCQHLLDKGDSCVQTRKSLNAGEHCPEKTLHPSTKIKLQLFPMDEGTRMGLEKDGYNPYLELTLSARKKISSVLKHLSSKWGGSNIAFGEIILFPYNMTEGLASYKWTLNDNDISTGDVHATIGSPHVFRLRYGWFSESETKSFGRRSTSAIPDNCLQPEGSMDSYSTVVGSREGKQIEVANEDFEPVNVCGATGTIVADKTSTKGLVEPMCNELRAEQPSLLWIDNLTNISIGGLLSEASLQGKPDNCNPKSNGSSAGLHPSQLVSDSLDAFIASMNSSQGAMLPPQGSSSSILDAEDTCHAFSFRKLSSLGKDDALASGGSANTQICSQDIGSKSSNYLNMMEINKQPCLSRDPSCQESEKDMLPCPQLYNDESSLGMSGFKWNESLGPFDLDLFSRKTINGDSLSFNKIFS